MALTSVIEKVHQQAGRFVSGTPIWAFDWDVCCILDGCRVDTFRESHPDAGSYWSVGASSKQWIERTFGEPRENVAYITGNPFSGRAEHSVGYYHAEPVQDTQLIETVPPANLAAYALAVWDHRDELGIDRIVVHFMQPHVPFRKHPKWFARFRESEIWGSNQWKTIGDEIPEPEWFDTYRDNLKWVLSDGVCPIQNAIDGTVGVTADHGNAAGEWGIYGHLAGVAVPSVRKVPWLSLDGDGNGIKTDVELGGREIDREQQLRALGYL